MIQRTYPDLLTAWQGLTEELAYKAKLCGALKWGVCLAYPDLIEVTIEDMLADNKLHLDMSSYTKSRWTRFLRRYFRTDLEEWVDASLVKLTKYPSRPFVSSYSINLNPEAFIIGAGAHGGHNYGGCLSSLQIRVHPKPTVILYSRACQIDKIGFLDLTLMHLIAKRMKESSKKRPLPAIRGTWVISLGFISAVSQVFYIQRFKKPVKGHFLKKRLASLDDGRDWRDVSFGPLRRSVKRNQQMATIGHIPGAVPVKNLSLIFTDAKIKKRRKRNASKAETDGTEG